MWRRLYRVAEIGVDRGEFAQLFLSRWWGDEWFGIDNYEPYPERDWPRDAAYQMALARLAPYGQRATLIRLGSLEAATRFADGSLDFVYVDAAHDYESVKADLNAWFPKVSDRGIIAGHDFDATHPGVVQAVTEFGAEIGQTVYLTKVAGFQEEQCPSWYAYVNGIPGPGWRRC